jgi:hypothetical protein
MSLLSDEIVASPADDSRSAASSLLDVSAAIEPSNGLPSAVDEASTMYSASSWGKPLSLIAGELSAAGVAWSSPESTNELATSGNAAPPSSSPAAASSEDSSGASAPASSIEATHIAPTHVCPAGQRSPLSGTPSQSSSSPLQTSTPGAPAVQLAGAQLVPTRMQAPTPQMAGGKPSSGVPLQLSSTPLQTSGLGVPGVQLDARHDMPTRWHGPTPHSALGASAGQTHVVPEQTVGAAHEPHAIESPHAFDTMPQVAAPHEGGSATVSEIVLVAARSPDELPLPLTELPHTVSTVVVATLGAVYTAEK